MPSQTRTPRSYWLQRSNRIIFMDMIKRDLGIRFPEDWYQLTRAAVLDLGGSGLLRLHRGSISTLLKDYMPDYDWKEWLFPMAPLRFWHKPENCRRYLEWLGEQLGFEEPEDWYQVKGTDLEDNYGTTLLRQFKSSVVRIVKTFFPEHEWQEWKFSPAPSGFWTEPKNRRRYLDWLGSELGYEKIEDWYQTRAMDLIQNHGNTLLLCYYPSVYSAIMSHFPEYEWQEWKFREIPRYFWHDLDNCRRYMHWLGEELGYTKPEDWYQVNREMFFDHHGTSLAAFYEGSPTTIVMKTFPEYEWLEWLFVITPKFIWADLDICCRYLDWLGEKLGFKKPRDWYGLVRINIKDNYGSALIKLMEYRLADLMELYLPDYKWYEWLFKAPVPDGYWRSVENCRHYMDWLARELGFKRPADWYQVTTRNFYENRGSALLRQYQGSIVTLLRAFYPEQDWKEWMFPTVPRGFWRNRSNRERYLEWLGTELGLSSVEDWLHLVRKDFSRNYGRSLLKLYNGSVYRVLSNSLPAYYPVHDALPG